jgi:hypothetical protein
VKKIFIVGTTFRKIKLKMKIFIFGVSVSKNIDSEYFGEIEGFYF